MGYFLLRISASPFLLRISASPGTPGLRPAALMAAPAAGTDRDG